MRYFYARSLNRILCVLTDFHQNEDVHGISHDSGVMEEERRWQNLLAQSPSKGDFEFDGSDYMM
jgi:hypothetical protein